MTPLPMIISRNPLQKIASIGINRRDVASHPVTYYTCPTGAKAKCKMLVGCTGTGAAATVDILVAGVIMFRWLSAGFVNNYLDAPRTLGATADQYAKAEFDLAAGEVVVSAQDSGTNAEINMFLEVQETPA